MPLASSPSGYLRSNHLLITHRQALGLVHSATIFALLASREKVGPQIEGERRASSTTTPARSGLISMTSNDGEVRIAATALAATSNTTGSPSLYTEFGGRRFTSQSDIYVLPADAEEHNRLDIQHFALTLTLDYLFPFRDLVTPLLKEGQFSRPEILDIGTGSGRWAVDMAVAYPSANVVGIDLVPPTGIPEAQIPSNCRFEINDANLAMERYSDTFSIAHGRMMNSGLKDVNLFFYQMARILKPGGILIMAGSDTQLRDENFEPFPFVKPGEPNFTWIQFVLSLSQRGLWNIGCTSDQSKLWWKEWLDANPNYSQTYIEDAVIPIGAWKADMTEKQKTAANCIRDNLAFAAVAWRRVLIADGHDEKDVNHWIEETVKELKEMKVHAYIRFRYVGAIRSNSPWEERQAYQPEDLGSREIIQGLRITEPWSYR